MRLVVLFGPPAVGKMTVGRELCARTGYKLFHNHMTIEPFLDIFDYGTPSFRRLFTEVRRMVLEEAIASGLPGLVFTFVWALELESDRTFLQAYVDRVEAAGGSAVFVELTAPLDVRQERNNTELRLAEKRSKRDRAFNDANLLELESYLMSTCPGVRTAAHDLLDRHPHLRIDNSRLPATEVAERVAAWLAQL